MPTLNDLVDEVKANLQGYALRQDRITYVANPSGLTTTSTQITVGSGGNLAKGIIEIDDELIWIDNFAPASNTLNVIPGFGRGYNGTTPSPHAENAQITLTPTFPRTVVEQAINDTINSFYPKLFSTQSTVFTFNAAQVAYPLPSQARDALYISWQTVGPSREWLPVNRWRMDRMANVAAFDTTATVNIYEKIMPGRNVQVWYSAIPNTLTNANDNFTDVTGLPESCRDVVTLGACYRLLSYVDSGRINLTSAEADLADAKLPSTAGASSSKYVFALFQQRLQEEAIKMQNRYPIRVHYSK